VAELVVQTPDGKQRRIPLERRITTVGRDAASDVPIDDPRLPPTALHIHFDGKEHTVACHEGANLLVNGRRRTTWRLAPGDVLTVGEAELVFSPSPEEGAPEVPVRPEAKDAVHALVQFSRRLLAATDLAGLLDALLDALVEVTHADRGFVIILEDGRMAVKAARNLSKDSVEDAVGRVSDSIVQKVVRTRRPLVVADALHDAEWSSSSSVVNLKLCSVMCAPLTARGEVFGVIYLGNDNVVDLFDVGALGTLTIFAAQASLLLQNALLLDDLRRENVVLREAAESRRYGEIVGTGPSMREVFRHIEKVAATDVTVLIQGETGTGKEMVAQEIHRRSLRAKGPFVAVNCGAVPEGLMESELFGHVKGSFTGAVATRTGRLQAADGGTLFLDEVGEMPPSLQVKLLRALQDRVVVKVGDTRSEPVDIRVIAATNKVLEDEVRRGAFREDLYYRLHVVSIRLPPLRERGDDILVLARWFLQRFSREFGSKARGFVPGAVTALRKFRWPGNIRELENRVKKAVVLANGPLLTADDLDLRPEEFEPAVPLAQALEEYRRRYINEVLERNGGNRTKTAKDLDVDPRTVFRHLERMESERSARSSGSGEGTEGGGDP